MASLILILLVDGLLVLAAGLFGYAGHVALVLSILAATALLFVWQVTLQITMSGRFPSAVRALRVESSVKRPHLVQALLQICLYLYWGLYWDEVWSYVPLIVVQLIFAYGFEMLLSWSRYRVWHAGFGPFPIVLSINLFLWFKEEYFVLQLALIVLTYTGT